MSKHRFSGYFNDQSQTQPDMRGFITNPLAETITAAQVQMYQAAYLQAKKETEQPEWPLAESWN